MQGAEAGAGAPAHGRGAVVNQSRPTLLLLISSSSARLHVHPHSRYEAVLRSRSSAGSQRPSCTAAEEAGANVETLTRVNFELREQVTRQRLAAAEAADAAEGIANLAVQRGGGSGGGGDGSGGGGANEEAFKRYAEAGGSLRTSTGPTFHLLLLLVLRLLLLLLLPLPLLLLCASV